MSTGLSHITFMCRDPDRMGHILRTILNAQEVYDSGAQTFSVSREKFFVVGETWIAVMQGDALPERSYNHVAFQIGDHEFEDRLARINAFGLDVRAPRPRIEGEGRSIYFHDEDNHLFELHTGTLENRLACYAKEKAA